MAAPPEITLKNLNGKFVMNKTLSTDPEPILLMQGVGWITRKAISISTITLSITEYEDPEGGTRIDVEQAGTGGVKGTTERRHLVWKENEHSDYIFGRVKGKSRFIKLAEVEDEFLKTGWLPEITEGEAIESYVESIGGGWVADQIWGFEEVDGKRYYVRHAVVKKGEEVKTARLVYDYQGPV